MPEPLIYEYGVEMDKLLKGLAAGEAAAESFEAKMASLTVGLKEVESVGVKAVVAAAEKHVKAAEKQAAAAKKGEEAEEKKAAAIAKMADRAEMAASALNLQGRSQELLIKIGGQYAEILRETGDANSELMKAWRAGLSPAENSARKMVELAAKTEDVAIQSKAGAVAVGELALRMEDQIRRQDTNVGSQNKLSRSLSELIDGQTRATTVAIAGAAAYQVQKQRLDAVETAMEALHLPGSGLVTTFKKIADSLETITERGTPMQATMLKVGIAVGAVGAAVGAAIVGVAAMGTAIIGLVAKSDEWNQELKKLGMSLDDAGTKRVDQAAASVDALGVSAKAVAVAMADEFAPAVEKASIVMIAIGLALRDKVGGAFDTVREKITSFAQTMTAIPEPVVAAISATNREAGLAIKAMQGMAVAGAIAATSITTVADSNADYAVQARELIAKVKEQTAAEREGGKAAFDGQELARDAIERRRKAEEKAYDVAVKLAQEQQESLARIKERFALQASEAAGIAAAKTAEAEEAAAHRARVAWGDTAQYTEQVTASQVDSSIADMARLVAASDAAAAHSFDVVSGGAHDLGEAWKSISGSGTESAEAVASAWSSSFSSIASSAGKLSDLLIKQSKRQGDAAERAAIIAFRIQQASGIASVAISTAQAVMMALGTIPPPASFVVAGAAALAGITQAAVILSQPPPSSAGPSAFSVSAPTMPDLATSVQSSGTQTAMASKTPQTAAALETSMTPSATASRYQDSPTVVTDAYFPASSRDRLVRVAPGDEFEATRSGALGQSAKRADPQSLAAMRENTREVQGLRKDFQALREALLWRNHFDQAAAPAGTV